MYNTNGNCLEILVKGRSITEYTHRGSVYVEGRKGSEYVIRYRNNSSTRKKVVISVDGLNVVSGNVNWKTGYVVEPWGVLDLPGWRKDDQNVAKFKFSSVGKSYNQHNDHGDVNNVGVIGVKVFHEEAELWKTPEIKHIYHHHNYWNWPHYYNYGPYYNSSNGLGIIGTSGSWGPIGAVNNNVQNSGGNLGVASVMNCSAEVKTAGGSTLRDRPRSATKGRSEARGLCASGSDFEPQQALGTKWGQNAEFKTGVSSYKFYDTASDTLLIYYDSREGLARRGINVRWHVEQHRPEAFPTTYTGVACPPPK